MPVSRIPPAAPTARFSASESVAFFVAILDMCFFGLLSLTNSPAAVCLSFSFGFANYKDIRGDREKESVSAIV